MNLNEYFEKTKNFKNKIIVISAKDEASKYIKCFKSKTLLGLKMDIKYRGSYVAVIDNKREFLYENNSAEKIECSYKVKDKYIDIVSAGFDAGNISSIKVGTEEFSINKTGLNIAIFNYKSLKLIDNFNCNTYIGGQLNLTK